MTHWKITLDAYDLGKCLLVLAFPIIYSGLHMSIPVKDLT
jgi:hypothetical protein